MAKKTGTGAPDRSGASAAATTADIQLTLAQAQRALAEALLVLASGRVPDMVSGAAAGEAEESFEHTGVLDLDEAGVLVVKEDGEAPWPVFGTPRNKTVRLEFTTRPEIELIPTALEPYPQAKLEALVGELARFMKTRSGILVLAEISCASTTGGRGGSYAG